ncbi:MAG: hypothetical protein KKH72_01660 [Alphaproteobacteria bacterium]|nr:hypothetical protein [Alphaproteobacteria bacterium]
MTDPKTERFPPPLADLLGKLSSRRVSPDVALDPVFHLRYEAYRRENFIPVNQEEICVDDLDETPNGMTFGIYVEDRLVSSIRVHLLTAEQRASPSMKVFPDILGPMLDKGMTFIDPSRFTIDRDATLALPALPFLTLRITTMATEYWNVDYTLSVVRPEHGAFYRRVFTAEKIGELRHYPGLDFDVELFRSRYQSVRGRVGQRFPIFKSTPEERKALFGPRPADDPFPHVRPTAIEADMAELQTGD